MGKNIKRTNKVKEQKEMEKQKMIQELMQNYNITKFVQENMDDEKDVMFTMDGFLIPIKKEAIKEYIDNKIQTLETMLGIKKPEEQTEVEVSESEENKKEE
jgi:hypothetical protein